MSPPQKQKIEHLFSLVREGLYEDNLNKLSALGSNLDASRFFSFLVFLFQLPIIFEALLESCDRRVNDWIFETAGKFHRRTAQQVEETLESALRTRYYVDPTSTDQAR